MQLEFPFIEDEVDTRPNGIMWHTEDLSLMIKCDNCGHEGNVNHCGYRTCPECQLEYKYLIYKVSVSLNYISITPISIDR